MVRIKRKSKRIKPRPVRKDCYFCKSKVNPYWRDCELLSKHLSPRSRILPRARTGVCAKHQRCLSEVIKQARHLGLLPFVTRINR